MVSQNGVKIEVEWFGAALGNFQFFLFCFVPALGFDIQNGGQILFQVPLQTKEIENIQVKIVKK